MAERQPAGSSPKSAMAGEALWNQGIPVDGHLSSTSDSLYPAKLSIKIQQGETTEVLIQTFIRKQLVLKAHTVTGVEETEECMTVRIDCLGRRLLRCGVCRQRCRQIHSVRKEREWRDLSMRKMPLKLRYRPRRVDCPRCGLRVEEFPWAEPWARVTRALSNAVAGLARELSWQGTARPTISRRLVEGDGIRPPFRRAS